MTLQRGSHASIGRMMLLGTAKVMAGRIARIVVTLFGTAALARILTPADFGVAAVAVMILPLSVALLDGFIDVPVMREDDLDRAGLSNLLWSAVAVMAGLGALIWAAAPWLAQILNSPRLGDMLRALCFGLLLQPFVSAGSALLRRQHRFAVVGIFLLVSGGAYVLIAVALALLDFGAWSLIIGQLGSLLITTVGVSVIGGVPVLPARRLQIAVAWRLGGVSFAARLLAWLSANIDTLFASGQLGAVGAGYYSRAYNFTTQLKEPFAVLDQTVRQAFLAQRSLDDVAASRATLGGLRLVVMAAALVSAMVIVLREPIVALLLGEQWSAVVLPLAILTAALPARIARMYLDSFTYTRGSVAHMVRRNLAIVALMAAGLWFWAEDGLMAIALVVAGLNLFALIFVGGAPDIAVAGTLTQRSAAMAPGYVAGIVLAGIGEIPTLIWPDMSQHFEWGARAALCAPLCMLFIAGVPSRWLPSSLAERRRGILRRAGRRWYE